MQKPLTLVLVDDEPLALTSLKRTLAGCEDITIAATFQNGREAAAQIPNLNPDVVFLDIEMPGLSGLEVARSLRDLEASLVFITAYSEHALQAFEVHAVNYILKPYQDTQVLETLARIRRDRDRQKPNMTALMGILDTLQRNPRYPTRLLIKENRRSFIVQVAEILWVRGARNYVELHTPQKTYLYRQTMDQLEAMLDPTKFVRIHRSTMVNLDELLCLEKPAKNQWEVLTRDGKRHAVSKGYRNHLEAILQGTEP